MTSSGTSVWLVKNLTDLNPLSQSSFAPVVGISGFGYAAYLDLADLDLDGRPEIIVADFTSNRVSVLQNLGPPGVVASNSFLRHDFTVGSGPRSVKAVDFDGDGRLDLAAACYNAGGAVVVLQNTTAGTNITFAPTFSVSDGSVGKAAVSNLPVTSAA